MTKKKKAVKEVKLGSEKPTGDCVVVLESSNGTQTHRGVDILECLDQIAEKGFKGKSVLKVEKGEHKTEMYLYPMRMRRLVANKLFRMIFAKRLSQMLT